MNSNVRKRFSFLKKFLPKVKPATKELSCNEPKSPVAGLSGCLDVCELKTKTSDPRLDSDVEHAINKCYSSISSAPGPHLKFHNPYQSTRYDILCNAATATSPDHISWEENSSTNSCETGSQFTPLSSWSEDDVEHSQVILVK